MVEISRTDQAPNSIKRSLEPRMWEHNIQLSHHLKPNEHLVQRRVHRTNSFRTREAISVISQIAVEDRSVVKLI